MKHITADLKHATHIATKGSMELYLRGYSYFLVVRNTKTVDEAFNEVVEDKIYQLDKTEAEFWRDKYTPELNQRDTTPVKPLQVRLPKYLDVALRKECVVESTTMNKKITSILAEWHDKASKA